MSLIRANRGSLNKVSIPNVLLKTMFRESGLVNFCHLNVSSIKPKMDELRSVFRDTNAHVISFSETWLKSYNTNKSVEIEGYKLLRCDRRLRKSGGVAIYLKNNVKFRILASSGYKYDLPPGERFELDYLLVELIFPDAKMLFGVFYKAVKTKEFDVLNEVFSKYAREYEHVVFAGDFNENLLDSDKRNRMSEFNSVFASNDLNVLNSLPTNYYETGASLLDLLVSRDKTSIKRITQIDTGMSGHDILVMSYHSPSVVMQNSRKMCRNLKSINEEELFVDACLMPWEEIMLLADSDSITAALVRNLKVLLDKHAPLRPVRERLKGNAPWFKQHINAAIIERDIAMRYWRFTRSTESHQIYRKLRNNVTALITKAKNSYYNNVFRNCKDSRTIWSKLRRLGIGKDNISNAPPFTAEEFNKFLCKNQSSETDNGTTIAASADVSTSGISTQISSNRNNTSRRISTPFSFCNIDINDTMKAIKQVTSKAVGHDEIPINFIKMTLPVTLPYINHMFNFVMMSSVYPEMYKKSKVFAVHKKSTKYELKDHRGVHILPALSKSLEKVMKWQVTAYLNEHDLLYQFQSGYRPKYSATTALLKVTQDVRENLHKRHASKRFITFMLLLDFSSAFDLVNHRLLIKKLRTKFLFSEFAINLIRSYLSGRSQAVQIDGYLSDFLATTDGVPQGSVLGPLLFSMFINDLPDVLVHCKCHLFADDVQLYLNHDWSNFKAGVDLINSDLDRIHKWTEENKLILNAGKSKAMVISESAMDLQDASLIANPILLNQAQIHYVNKVEVLGLWINSTFTWSDQVSKMMKNVYGGLRCLWNCGPFLPFNKRVMLVKALLLPHFNYCDFIMCDAEARLVNSIQVAMNACIRFAFNMKRREHISTQESALLGCSFSNYKKYRMCLMIRSVLISRQPEYLFEMLKFTRSVRNPTLIVPWSVRNILSRSFFVQATSLWNSLPLELKRNVSSASFPVGCLQFFASG